MIARGADRPGRAHGVGEVDARRYTPVHAPADPVAATPLAGGHVAPTLGFGVMALHAAGALVAGAVLLTRRDT